MTELQERWDRLAYWIGPYLGAEGAVTISDYGVPDGIGYSAETLLFTANVPTAAGDRAQRLVLRGETPDPAVYPAQVDDIDVEIEIQHRIMSTLAASTGIPVAPIIGADLTDEAIGTPFFVMAFVDGVVPPVDPPYPAAGFFAEATPEQRHTMVANGLQVMADVHAVDWRGVGLDWLAPAGVEPTLRRQLDLWSAYAERELRGRVHPDMERALAILRADLPEPSAPTLCWGDPRLGNIIWQDFACASVTDWEAAAIAPAELDLGWWLMFDRSCHEAAGIDRPEGEPTREEQVALYEEAVGREVGDTFVYELLAAYRYSAIVVRIMNRWVERQMMAPGPRHLAPQPGGGLPPSAPGGLRVTVRAPLPDELPLLQAIGVAAGRRFAEVGLDDVADDPPLELAATSSGGGRPVGPGSPPTATAIPSASSWSTWSTRPPTWRRSPCSPMLGGRGHGMALLRHVEKWARAKGFPSRDADDLQRGPVEPPVVRAAGLPGAGRGRVDAGPGRPPRGGGGPRPRPRPAGGHGQGALRRSGLSRRCAASPRRPWPRPGRGRWPPGSA